jgi:hypothetical protein
MATLQSPGAPGGLARTNQGRALGIEFGKNVRPKYVTVASTVFCFGIRFIYLSITKLSAKKILALRLKKCFI